MKSETVDVRHETAIFYPQVTYYETSYVPRIYRGCANSVNDISRKRLIFNTDCASIKYSNALDYVNLELRKTAITFDGADRTYNKIKSKTPTYLHDRIRGFNRGRLHYQLTPIVAITKYILVRTTTYIISNCTQLFIMYYIEVILNYYIYLY